MLHASPVVQVVLLILLLFSAFSWAIIVYKSGHLRRAAQQNAAFLAVFRKSSRFSEVQASLRQPAGESAGRPVPVRLR